MRRIESKAEDAGNAEPDAKRRQQFPASMGLSVFLPPGPTDGSDAIEVIASWADYVPEEISEDHSEKILHGWKRVPRGPYSVRVPLDTKQLSSKKGVRWPESTGLCFRGELRTTDMEGLEPGTRVLSLFLVNDRAAVDRDLNFAFQVQFTLRYAGGFVPRPDRRGEDASKYDQRVLALLFRDKCEWAVGHNTSVQLPAPDASGSVTELSTTQLPQYSVRGVKHLELPRVTTGMMELAEMDGPALRNALIPLIEEYAAWIQQQRDVYLERDELVDDAGHPSKTKYTRAVVYCEGSGCLFSEKKRPGQGLPVLFVDEQIYRELPDFLVATVDKFAMMPWRGDAGMLFGRATHLDPQRAHGVMHDAPKGAKPLPEGLYPPELIVQDQMHLISGPLGTMVGLYETAIDYLSERVVNGTRRAPKVVCSTATVRRAREQIRALFDRELAIFPPRGIDDGDHFFATVDTESTGRLYVGVAAPGRALRAVSVRTYATLLAAAAKHFDRRGEPKQPADPYMTLVGYFNSLRELGGMRRLVEDEVSNRVKNFSGDKRPHHYVGPHPWAGDRKLLLPAELTSRASTEAVKDTKRRLNVRRANEDDSPLDTALASSMISVGLDVDRLGLMVVTGQPKTTSEYIQATSRVGRAYPGLVVTCLNASRPRDRSHYERFCAYHESFYREVEATSVTPFSLQTLDRGMVGTLISMLRHGIMDMEPARGAMRLHEHRNLAEAVLEVLVKRGREHRDWHDSEAEERIAAELRARGKNFLDAWEKVIDRAVEGAAERTWSKQDRCRKEGLPLLHTATDEQPADLDERRFQAPTSMRDVEPSTHIWLRFAELDKRN